MSKNYAQNFGSTKVTPQSKPIPDAGQVKNSAGGFAWKVSDETLLDRFLILGTEGGSYYATEREMTYKVGDAVRRLIKAKGPYVVERAAEISEQGRAPKNDPAILVLAACAVEGDQATKEAAYRAVNRVCRIGTHIFQFAQFMTEMKGGSAGWGKGLQRAIARWYNEKSDNDLGYQVIKYQNRAGWTHADLLQEAHVLPVNDAHDAIFGWVRAAANAARVEHRKDDPEFVDPATKRYRHGVRGTEKMLPVIFDAHKRMQAATTAKQVVKVLADHPSFPWEGIPSEQLGHAEVWEALAPNLPMTAMVRNLARMTASGALAAGSDVAKILVTKLHDEEAIRKSRIHPIGILTAMMTYGQGHGMRGSLTWNPVTKVIDALDDAFYLSFGNVVPTGKDMMLAVDVSGSMDCGMVAGVPGLTPRIAAAAMALVTDRAEDNTTIVGFANGSAKNPVGGVKGNTAWGGNYAPMLEPINVSSRQRLDDVVKVMKNVPMGGTDCSLPMRAAQAAKMKVEVFVVYTDSETWAGPIHASQALEQYRQAMGIPAKLAVVAMTANDFTIADPKDPLMLDVIGMDVATPNIISEFARM